MLPTGYPLIYCPPGVQRPAHCPHLGAVGLKGSAVGPDGKCGGQTYGGPYLPASKHEWSPTPEGWWVRLAGYMPQNLIRMDISERIARYHLVEGASRDQWWQVPVLIRPADPEHHNRGFVSALDRVRTAAGFVAPKELEDLQVFLLAIVRGIPLARTPKARNAKIYDLVLKILQQTHHVSDHEMIIGGWMSESLQLRIILAATDRPQAYKRAGGGRA